MDDDTDYITRWDEWIKCVAINRREDVISRLFLFSSLLVEPVLVVRSSRAIRSRENRPKLFSFIEIACDFVRAKKAAANDVLQPKDGFVTFLDDQVTKLRFELRYDSRLITQGYLGLTKEIRR